MHTTKPTQWPLWIRLLLPVLTPTLSVIGELANRADRVRDRTFDVRAG